MKLNKSWILIALGAGVLAGGCDVGDKSPQPLRTAEINAKDPKFAAEAGLNATVDATPPFQPMQLAKSKYFGSRGDAFALLPAERAFNGSQLAANLVSKGGGFSAMFTEPEEVVEAAPVTEPLPLWRLAGVVIGDGVSALLDMGTRTIDIRPGMKIPDTDWTVVSIDSDKAVLKRANKLPHTFTVPLQSKNAGGGGGTGGGTGGSGGGTGGGGKQMGLGAAGG
ncbi:MAG: hypothetical protein JSS66_11265 [Armatimonadetes bacterium]|nr:hypothetical protein [Armatimonadota bacterium]